MATVATEILHDKITNTRVYKWVLADGETGKDIIIPSEADVSVQAFGSFGGATLTIEGSLDPDPRLFNYFTALKYDATPFTLTAAGGDLAVQNFYRMRPRLTGGSSASVTVFMLVR